LVTFGKTNFQSKKENIKKIIKDQKNVLSIGFINLNISSKLKTPHKYIY